jgi:hypothetical protein
VIDVICYIIVGICVRSIVEKIGSIRRMYKRKSTRRLIWSQAFTANDLFYFGKEVIGFDNATVIEIYAEDLS